MRRRFAALSVLCAALSASLAAPVAAQDVTAMVLGIRSVEGDDDFARNLTGSLRHAASQVPGWSVSDAEVSLSQMSLAHGCDEPDAACMAEIAGDLDSQRIIYGTVRRTGAGEEYSFALTLYLFNAESGQIEQSLTDTIPRIHSDIDDLRPYARRYITQLADLQQVGRIRVETTAGATVSVDGEVAGTADATGIFVAQEVPVGRRTVEVSAEGRQGFRASVTVVADQEAEVAATLDEVVDTSGGGSLPWAGLATLGGSAVFAILTIWTWAKINGLSDDADYDTYRRLVPVGNNVCSDISAGTTYGAPDDVFRGAGNVCDQADTLEILQYVFLGAAVAAGAVGTWLVLSHDGGDDSEATASGTRLRLGSRVDRHGGAVSATLSF